MDTTSRLSRNLKRVSITFLTFSFLLIILTNLLSTGFLVSVAHADSSTDLNYYEQQVIALTNQDRAQNNLPPLRLNRDLTAAARWMSQDSVVNEAAGYCNHKGSDGSMPGDRDKRFGYNGVAGYENVYCGFSDPNSVVSAWFNETPPNDGHRLNILNPSLREIGVGYYYDANTGRGYVTQDFGYDGSYLPIVINNEATTTTSPNVNLYIYGAASNVDPMYSMGQPVQMLVSNRFDFVGASWQNYTPNLNWTLDSNGYGFKNVYVELKDGAGKISSANDNIYYGPDTPNGYFDSLQQGATHQISVSMSGLNSNGLPYMQFSNNWGLNSQSANMSLNWGKGGFVSDGGASYGKAFQLQPNGANESAGWVFSSSYMLNLPSQVYFRIKLSTLNTNATVRLAVGAGGVNTTRNLNAGDFHVANTYQEFPVSFTQAPNSSNQFLTLQVGFTDGDGKATLNVDKMDIYTAPEPFSITKNWNVPDQNYRGAAIKVRYTDNAANPTFSDGNPAGPFLLPTYNPLIGNPSFTYAYYLPFLANNYTPAGSAGSYTTLLIIQNVGSNQATIQKQYYNNSGNAYLNGNTALNPSAQLADFDMVANGTSGAGVIYSTQPLNVLVVEATPYGGSAYAVPAGTSSNLTAPLAINGSLGFATQLTVFNTAASATSATVNFYDQNGNLQPNATRTLNIGAKTSVTLDQTNNSGLPSGFYGFAQITGATGSQLVAQVLEQNPGSHFTALVNASSSSSSNLYAAAIFNNVFGGFYTGANIINPNDNAVTVTVNYYDNNGQQYASAPFTLGGHAIAPIFDAATSGAGLPNGGLPSGFYGAASVSAQGGGVVMVVNEAGGRTASGAAQSGTYSATASGHNSVGLPIVANNGAGFTTGVTVLNTSGQAVSGTITYYNNDGSMQGSPLSFTVGANASYAIYQGAASQGLPNGFSGQAIITENGGSDLVVTTNAQSSNLFYTYTE